MNKQELEQNKIISELGEYPTLNFHIVFYTKKDNLLPQSYNHKEYSEKFKKILFDNSATLINLSFSFDHYENFSTSLYFEIPPSFKRYTLITVDLSTTEFLINSIIELIKEFFSSEFGEFLQVQSVDREQPWRVI
jgi:hypothetical protein